MIRLILAAPIAVLVWLLRAAGRLLGFASGAFKGLAGLLAERDIVRNRTRRLLWQLRMQTPEKLGDTYPARPRTELLRAEDLVREFVLLQPDYKIGVRAFFNRFTCGDLPGEWWCTGEVKALLNRAAIKVERRGTGRAVYYF